MNKCEFDNQLRRECMDLPNLGNHLLNDNIETTPDYQGLRLALSTPDLCQPRKVVLTGCGDSYCAAVAGARAFTLLGQVFDARAIPAVEFSRHYPSGEIGTEPYNPLVYIISKSGSPARCVEVARRVNETNLGGLSVGVTATPDSPMAKECKRILKVDVPELENPFNEYPPGCRSYYASMYAVFSSAIRMGEVKGQYSMAEASNMRKATQRFAEAVNNNFEQIDEQIFEVAKAWKDLDSFEFVSSGADMATAWFTAAKVYEASGDIATYENVEDFCHICYFADHPEKVGTVFYVNYKDPSYPRYKKAIASAVSLGRPTLIITDAPVSDFPEEAVVCSIPSPEYYWQMPIAHYVPGCLLAGYIARLKGVAFFRTDMRDVFVSETNKLRTSKIEIVR